jgi:hypothetical protein
VLEVAAAKIRLEVDAPDMRLIRYSLMSKENRGPAESRRGITSIRATADRHLLQCSLCSSCMATAAGLRTLIRAGHGPDDRNDRCPLTFLDPMPSAPSRQAWAKRRAARGDGFIE